MERITTAMMTECPEFVFETAMASGPEEAEKIIAADAANDVDGYVVYQLNCWNKVVQSAAATGKPVLYADFKYAGRGASGCRPLAEGRCGSH